MYIVVSKQKGKIVGANANLEWAPGVPADEEQVRKIVEKLRGGVTPFSVSYLDALRDGAVDAPIVYLRKNARAAAKALSDMHSSFEWEVYQVETSDRKADKRPVGWQITVGDPPHPSAWNYLSPEAGLTEDDYVFVEGAYMLKTRKAARTVLQHIKDTGDWELGYKAHPVYNKEEVSNG